MSDSHHALEGCALVLLNCSNERDMKKQTTTLIAFFLAALCFGFKAQAQTTYKLNPKESSFKVLGTSTLHDWHMEGAEASGQCVVNADGSIVSGNVTLQAESLKSGKGGMDKNAYKALKTGDYADISFTVSAVEGDKISGSLTIAGVNKPVTFEGNVSQNGDKITVSGTTEFLLTDFKIDPPKALMGTVKTGDKVSLEIKSTFIK